MDCPASSAYAAAPVSGAGGPLKTEEKELPAADGEDGGYLGDGADEEGLLCILDVAYAPGQVDQIPVRVGDKASALAQVRILCVCIVDVYNNIKPHRRQLPPTDP